MEGPSQIPNFSTIIVPILSLPLCSFISLLLFTFTFLFLLHLQHVVIESILFESKTKTESSAFESESKSKESEFESESSIIFFPYTYYFLNITKIILIIWINIIIFHICHSRDGLVPRPQVIKARDRVQGQVIDIRIQDQDQAKSVSKPKLASRPLTLTVLAFFSSILPFPFWLNSLPFCFFFLSLAFVFLITPLLLSLSYTPITLFHTHLSLSIFLLLTTKQGISHTLWVWNLHWLKTRKKKYNNTTTLHITD